MATRGAIVQLTRTRAVRVGARDAYELDTESVHRIKHFELRFRFARESTPVDVETFTCLAILCYTRLQTASSCTDSRCSAFASTSHSFPWIRSDAGFLASGAPRVGDT
jgi:hypothetical protein